MSAGSRFEDRFDASTYADDEPVGIFQHPGDADALWVPEQLLWRLVFVARAYSLHMLPLLGGPEPVTLNRLQMENLLDEVAFIGDLLRADPLLSDLTSRMGRYLRHILSTSSEPAVTIEGN
jgi:hypothetical protein